VVETHLSRLVESRGQFTLPDSIDAAYPHKAQAPLPLGIHAAAFAGQAPGETFMPG
jgi:hypothetical protein